eukprot:1161424-Pelagomonas_calceolata.AAC.12
MYALIGTDKGTQEPSTLEQAHSSLLMRANRSQVHLSMFLSHHSRGHTGVATLKHAHLVQHEEMLEGAQPRHQANCVYMHNGAAPWQTSWVTRPGRSASRQCKRKTILMR